MKEVLYQVMSDREFDSLVKKTYGYDYNFVADNECGNDSEHAFNCIDGNQDVYMLEDLNEFKNTGNYSMITRALLNDMVKNSIIQPGNYLIKVCW